MTDKEEAIKQLRLLLEEGQRAENIRHRFATTYFEEQLASLRAQCTHPIEAQLTHLGVFPGDTYTSCDICQGDL